MFKHRLALALGRFVSEIDQMSNREFQSWQAYYAHEPFGQWRDNYHAGVVASVVASCSSGKAVKISDFMLKSEEQKKKEKFDSFMKSLRGHARRKSDTK